MKKLCILLIILLLASCGRGNNVVWKEADTIVVIKIKKITKSNGEIKKWYKIKLYGETARDPSFWITSDSTWTVGTNLYLASKK